MRVSEIDVGETERGARISADVIWEDRRRGTDRIEFLYRATAAAALATPGDALLAAAFPLAVALGEDVSIDAPVSQRLLDAAPAIAEQFVALAPSFRRSVVDAVGVDRSTLAPTQVAAGFSGGVDSFFTALRPRREPVTLLMTMLGLDFAELIPHLEPRLQRLSRAAAELGKQHVVVESNVFSLELEHLPWIRQRGGVTFHSLVAAQALGLGALVRRFYIARDEDVEQPRRDIESAIGQLWSTEGLDVLTDGARSRYEKVRTIASSPVVLNSLHVCIAKRRDPGNCGRCDKCVGTAIALQLAGSIDRCMTLSRVTPATVRRTNIAPGRVGSFELCRRLTDDPALHRAITVALWKARFRLPLRPLARLLRRAGFRRG